MSDATCNIAGFGYRRPDNEEDEDEDDLSSVQLDVHTVVDHEVLQVSEHVIVINLLPLLFQCHKVGGVMGQCRGNQEDLESVSFGPSLS